LASVEQYPYEQAKKAAEILFELLVDKKNSKKEEEETTIYQNVLIEGQLVIHNK
jgi:hypothetical protein